MYYTVSICKDWITVASNHDEKVLAKQFIEMYLCDEQKLHKMRRKKNYELLYLKMTLKSTLTRISHWSWNPRKIYFIFPRNQVSLRIQNKSYQGCILYIPRCMRKCILFNKHIIVILPFTGVNHKLAFAKSTARNQAIKAFAICLCSC